jgi:hypothetical protein
VEVVRSVNEVVDINEPHNVDVISVAVTEYA